ncbi:hypothetical protein WH96_12410 [Kiloniella spongiae]|uniref:Uncharacterized protein n=1 Tax=Kiloniella spongiae TaxID=1489064 RepID=A0A0H2ME81_9PROT|nr:hypothetical protein WH96_12410 [Kiloniella spongiae]
MEKDTKVIDVVLDVFFEITILLILSCLITGALIWLAKKTPLLRIRPFLSGWIIATTLWLAVSSFPNLLDTILSHTAGEKVEYRDVYTEFYLAFYPTTIIALLYYIRDLKVNFRMFLGE